MIKKLLKSIALIISFLVMAFAVACAGDGGTSSSGAGDGSSSTGGSDLGGVATYTVEYYFESETEIGVYVKDESMTFTNSASVGTMLKPDMANLPQYELNEEMSSPKEGVLPSQGITFTYYYRVRVYTVEFLSNGGSSVAVQYVRHGGKATMPATPTHGNPEAVLLGWYTENNQKYDFNTPVEANMVLKAEWETPTYGPIV